MRGGGTGKTGGEGQKTEPGGESMMGETFGISRIGSKIKGVFKSNTLEGAMLPSYAMEIGRASCRERV